MNKFQLGRTVATPGALKVLADAGLTTYDILQRHTKGDWGDMSHEDAAMNDGAITPGSDCYGCRIFSSYELSTGEKVWCITTAIGDDDHRESTCILLPDEY